MFFGEGRFTTLRKKASTTGVDSKWTTSGAIGDIKANGTAELEALVAALAVEGKARAIGAGLLVAKPKTDVLVSSFTNGAETTRFYAKPDAATAGQPGAAAFVDAAEINPNEDTYPGWHQGVKDATGTFETLKSESGTPTGLQMTEKSQLLNGFAEADFLPNAAGFAAGMQVSVEDTTDGVWAQVPVFYYPEGVIGEKFTTLRALVPESGNLADATEWVSSGDIVGAAGVVVAKNVPAPFDAIVAALGNHKVLGYGVYQDRGTSVLKSITFNGQVTEFFKAEITDPTDPSTDPGTDPSTEPGTDPGTDPGTKPGTKNKLKDVAKGDKFYADIMWMSERGITTGNKQVDAKGNVTYAFLPKDSVTREAIAAFMFRLEAPKGYKAPKSSPFADVKPGDKFYKEIAWMHETKRATGFKQASGKAKFQPKSYVTREAVAAFLYREAAPKSYKAPKVSPFADVKPGDKFYKELTWMLETKRSTGIKQASGKPKYDAKANLSREAMAAFLHRADKLK